MTPAKAIRALLESLTDQPITNAEIQRVQAAFNLYYGPVAPDAQAQLLLDVVCNFVTNTVNTIEAQEAQEKAKAALTPFTLRTP